MGMIDGIFRIGISLILRYPLGISVPHTHGYVPHSCSCVRVFGELKERDWGDQGDEEKRG